MTFVEFLNNIRMALTRKYFIHACDISRLYTNLTSPKKARKENAELDVKLHMCGLVGGWNETLDDIIQIYLIVNHKMNYLDSNKRL
jgi:hypothetical protein